MVNGEILHQKLPQDLRLGPIWECTKVLNLYSSNKNSLLETGLLRMFMYAELHVSWLYYCWAPLTYFFHYALWLLRKMTVKSVRCGGRGVSHCSPTLHLHCWLAQRSCTVVSVCKCNYALCEVFWLWALWQCDMHLMLPVSGQDTKPKTYHVMMAPDKMVQNQSLPQLHGYRLLLYFGPGPTQNIRTLHDSR